MNPTEPQDTIGQVLEEARSLQTLYPEQTSINEAVSFARATAADPESLKHELKHNLRNVEENAKRYRERIEKIEQEEALVRSRQDSKVAEILGYKDEDTVGLKA